MANTPEGCVKADVRKVLDKHGAWYYMPVQNGMGVTGIPDFVCCWHGLFIGIECKAPGKLSNVTPAQRRIGEQIIGKGEGYWIATDNAADVVALLKNIAVMHDLEEPEHA